MAAFRDLFTLVLGWWSSAAATGPPDSAGAEFRLPPNRGHFAIANNRGHYRLPPNKAHYQIPSER